MSKGLRILLENVKVSIVEPQTVTLCILRDVKTASTDSFPFFRKFDSGRLLFSMKQAQHFYHVLFDTVYYQVIAPDYVPVYLSLSGEETALSVNV